jgi:hypothetical protein
MLVGLDIHNEHKCVVSSIFLKSFLRNMKSMWEKGTHPKSHQKFNSTVKDQAILANIFIMMSS